MDILSIRSRCSTYDQLYLELVLKGCRQLQHVMRPRFDSDAARRETFEADYQLQTIVDSTARRENLRSAETETSPFSFSPIRSDACDRCVYSSGDTNHVTEDAAAPFLMPLDGRMKFWIRSDLTVLRKLKKKRKTVFQQLGTAKKVSEDTDLTACESDEMLQEIMAKLENNLHKYKLYQDKDVLCRERIVQKLEDDPTLTETHESSLALVIDRLTKIVQDIFGTRLSMSMDNASGKSFESLSSTSINSKRSDSFGIPDEPGWRAVDYGMFLASSFKAPSVGDLLPDESGYKRVIRTYQPPGPGLWELPLFIGQWVKQKGRTNSEGIAYGSRRGSFGGIRSGYFPAKCVTSA